MSKSRQTQAKKNAKRKNYVCLQRGHQLFQGHIDFEPGGIISFSSMTKLIRFKRKIAKTAKLSMSAKRSSGSPRSYRDGPSMTQTHKCNSSLLHDPKSSDSSE
jgi:hypothetical protein